MTSRMGGWGRRTTESSSVGWRKKMSGAELSGAGPKSQNRT
jgi:hypothetical protein